MAELIVIGKLCGVRESGATNDWVRFGVRELDSLDQNGQKVKNYFNFFVKKETSLGKFLLGYGQKIDVVKCVCNAKQVQDEQGKDKIVTNVKNIDVVSWRFNNTNESGQTTKSETEEDNFVEFTADASADSEDVKQLILSKIFKF